MKISLPGDGEIEYTKVTAEGVDNRIGLAFEFLSGDVNWLEYGAKWISPKLNNGYWDYWIVMELVNLYDAMGEDETEHEFMVTLNAVSPDATGEDMIHKALASCPPPVTDNLLDDEGLFRLDRIDEKWIVESLFDYGISSLLWDAASDDAQELIDKATRQAEPITNLFGFFMDGPKNHLGHTGWDFIKGDLSIETALANQEKWRQ